MLAQKARNSSCCRLHGILHTWCVPWGAATTDPYPKTSSFAPTLKASCCVAASCRVFPLAVGGCQGKMTDKIVALVWELTIPADAPRQLLKLQTMEKVVSSYLGMMKVRLRQHAWP